MSDEFGPSEASLPPELRAELRSVTIAIEQRNRVALGKRLSSKARVEPRFTTFDGGDPIAFVVDENLHRRQLNPSQIALAGAKIETLNWGQRTDYINETAEASRDASAGNGAESGNPAMSRKQIAQAMNSNRCTVSRASAVLTGWAGRPYRHVIQSSLTWSDIMSNFLGSLFGIKEPTAPDPMVMAQQQANLNKAAARAAPTILLNVNYTAMRRERPLM